MIKDGIVHHKLIDDNVYDEAMMQVQKHEGFIGTQYRDHLGYPTIGYGTKLPLTEDEGKFLQDLRFDKMVTQLLSHHEFINNLPKNMQVAICNMCYQLGVAGLLKFKKMFEALKVRDYQMAADEALDSLWAKQTPNRANEIAHIFRMGK